MTKRSLNDPKERNTNTMKNQKTNKEAAAPSPKGMAKLKTLKLTKEIIETLSDHDAELIKGGKPTFGCVLK